MEQYVVFKSHGQFFAILVQNVDRIIEANQFYSITRSIRFYFRGL